MKPDYAQKLISREVQEKDYWMQKVVITKSGMNLLMLGYGRWNCLYNVNGGLTLLKHFF